ncbi:Rsp5p-dependent ubiquitination, sorting of cargo proteins at the multivesicular body, partial [Nowakowskiella sp. JEL0078]
MGFFDSCRGSSRKERDFSPSRESLSPFKGSKAEEVATDFVPPVPRIDSMYVPSSSSNTMHFPTSNFVNSIDQSVSLSRTMSEQSHSPSMSHKSLPYGPPPRAKSREALHSRNFSSATLNSNSQLADSTVGQPSYEQIRLLHQRGHEAWKFSLEDVDNGMNFTGVTVSGNGFTVRYGTQRQGERTVMTNLPLHRDPTNPSRSFYYFETTIKELDRTFPQAVLAIGFATKPYDPDLMLGRANYSTAILSDDGSILQDGAKARTAFAKQFGVGQTIGCGYDSFRGNIFFTIDGKWMGNAVTSDVKRPYHGAISANGPAVVTINVGQNSFKFDAANPPPNVSPKQAISTPEKIKDDITPAPLLMKVTEIEQAIVGSANIKNLKPSVQAIEMVDGIPSKEELRRIEKERKEQEQRVMEWTTQQQQEIRIQKRNPNQTYQQPTSTSPTLPVITPRGASRDRQRQRKIENLDVNQPRRTPQVQFNRAPSLENERERTQPQDRYRDRAQSREREIEYIQEKEQTPSRERDRVLPLDRERERLQDRERATSRERERERFTQERQRDRAPSRERERERTQPQDRDRDPRTPQMQLQIQSQGTSRDRDRVASRDRTPRSTPDKFTPLYPQTTPNYQYTNYDQPNQSPVNRITQMSENKFSKGHM